MKRFCEQTLLGHVLHETLHAILHPCTFGILATK